VDSICIKGWCERKNLDFVLITNAKVGQATTASAG